MIARRVESWESSIMSSRTRESESEMKGCVNKKNMFLAVICLKCTCVKSTKAKINCRQKPLELFFRSWNSQNLSYPHLSCLNSLLGLPPGVLGYNWRPKITIDNWKVNWTKKYIFHDMVSYLWGERRPLPSSVPFHVCRCVCFSFSPFLSLYIFFHIHASLCEC